MTFDELLGIIEILQKRFPHFYAAADRASWIALYSAYSSRSRMVARMHILPKAHAARERLPLGAIEGIERATADEEQFFCRCRDMLLDFGAPFLAAIPTEERQRIEAEVLSCEPTAEELAILAATPLPLP